MRIPVRRKGEVNSVAMHKRYQQHYKTAILGTLFTRVLEEFNKGIVTLLLAGHEVKLPHNMGTLYVEKKKVNFNHLQLDFGHWQKTGEKRYHLNRHSDNFRAHFHWRKLTSVLPGKSLYQFVPARQNKRALATCMLVRDGHKKYQQYVPIPRIKAHEAR